MTRNRHIVPFWLMSLSLVFGLTLPALIQDGMFQDSLVTSSVSRNLAIGKGTFWFPQFSTLNLESIPSFHEHPPLVYGIQSLFYKALGDSIYVERFYTLIVLILHIVLINKLWKEIFLEKPEYKIHGWIPVIFWIIFPVCFWSFRNNMMENTLSIFTLASVIISFRAIKNDSMNLICWLLSGFFIFLASFSKGVPGLFPVAFPLVFYGIKKDISLKRCIIYTAVLLLVPVLIYAVLILFPESRQSLSIYFFDRVIRKITSMPTTDLRWYTAVRLISEMIPGLILAGIAIFAGRKKLKISLAENKELFLIFFLTGLCASLPLMLTMVQKGYYLVPSFPYFAIALGILSVPVVSSVLKKSEYKSSGYKIFYPISVIVLTGVLLFTSMQKGKTGRDKDIISDVYEIGRTVPRSSTMSVPLEMYDQYDFILQGYLVRYFDISISPYDEYDFFLREKTESTFPPDNYKKLLIPLKRYELYKKR